MLVGWVFRGIEGRRGEDGRTSKQEMKVMRLDLRKCVDFGPNVRARRDGIDFGAWIGV